MILKLKHGEVEIELYDKIAPNHVKRFKELAAAGKYDGVVFHRVTEGFMAQTGDVKFGNSKNSDFRFEGVKKGHIVYGISFDRSHHGPWKTSVGIPT